MRLLLIAVFGAIGTLARYGLQGFLQVKMGSTFPYGTLVINLTGCFFLGLIGQITLNRMVVSPELRMAIAIGFFGGYTTFSSYGLQTLNLARDGEWLGVALNIVGSNVLGLLAVYLGWVGGRALQAKFHGGIL